MEYKDIKKLMDDVGNSKLSEVEIEFPDGTKVSLKKNEIKEKIITEQVAPKIVENTVKSEPVNNNLSSPKEAKKVEGNVVKSPMVGTFYAKSSPTAENFVRIGSKVKKGDTLCIIEAMKLMNEIESEFDGEIVEICVNNEDIVEYGKPLFKIK